MIEQNLGSSQFLGRDGFRWWIGQIAPLEAQKEQVTDGKGWGQRYKVRIMGYHPFNEDISNDDLPYAQLLMPVTAGSGGGQYASSARLNQGDTVIGFFLDGDDAQVPMILGHFNRTEYTSTEAYTRPFVPFTGFNGEHIKPSTRVPQDESNDQREGSQPTPSTVGERKDQAGAGQVEQVADTCQPNPISNMANVVENLAMRVEQLSLAGSNLKNEIRAAADIIEGMANRFVGTMIEKLFDELEGLGKQGLRALYNLVYSKVLAATQSPLAAHAAGVAAQTAMLPPVNFLQEAIGCAANAAVEGLTGTIEDLLEDMIDSGRNYAGCLGAQFTGAFANRIIDKIADEMTKPLDGVAKIIAPGFKVADFLLGVSDVLNQTASFLDCNQSNKGKCPKDKEYVVGGSGREKGEDPFDYVLNAMQLSRGAASLSNDFERQYGKWDIFSNGSLLSESAPGIIPGGCYGGPPQNCTGPYVEIYGGEGAGAAAEVIMGYFIDNAGLRPLVGSVERAGSIIGAKVTSPGSGYRYPPLVNFRDKCDIGYGAIGRAILGGPNNDQVVAIVMDTTGENYPAIIPENAGNLGIVDVVVSNPGRGYVPGDRIIIPGIAETGEVIVDSDALQGVDVSVSIATTSPIFDITLDDNGGVTDVKVLNILRYEEILPALTVQSNTGRGAVLKPIFGDIPADPIVDPVFGQVGVASVIDCI